MLSKNQAKLISSLKHKKHRDKNGLFVVEGIKGIREFLASEFILEGLWSTEAIFGGSETLISLSELKKISKLSTPNTAVAVFKIPIPKPLAPNGLIVALDSLRDPGNLGTIIRLCDWYGVEHLVCSSDTVDCYNPKTVQASMGSLSRVGVHYLSLEDFLRENSLPIYATAMQGSPISKLSLPENAILVMGNEANGISNNILEMAHQTLSISKYNKEDAVESLNVAVATAICLQEFRRNY